MSDEELRQVIVDQAQASKRSALTCCRRPRPTPRSIGVSRDRGASVLSDGHRLGYLHYLTHPWRACPSFSAGAVIKMQGDTRSIAQRDVPIDAVVLRSRPTGWSPIARRATPFFNSTNKIVQGIVGVMVPRGLNLGIRLARGLL
jgi:hypothetical protein